MKKKRISKPQGVLLFAIIVVALACESEHFSEANHKNPVETNNEENIWQQTALNTFKTVSALATSPKGSIFAGTCGDGIFRSMDRGASWTSVSQACAKVIAVRENGDIFACVQWDHILRSTDNGTVWQLLRAPANDLTSCDFNAVGEIFVGSLRHDESRGGIHRSNDNGDHWQTIFPDSIGVYALAINKQGAIFAGTGLGVVRSFDNGETWSQINNGFRDRRNVPYVTAFAINPINGNVFAASSFDGIYRSTNNGESWLLVGLDLPDSLLPYLYVNSFIFNSQGHAFVGCGGYNVEPEGVFRSMDNGETWSQINNGLTNSYIFSLAVDELGYVYAGTNNQGVFRTIKSITSQ